MKKRLLGLILALTCLLLPILTSCGDDEYQATLKVKPITVTLYGIKGEGTTDEAIKAVQDKMNEYTEGNLSARVLLRLFTEEEYPDGVGICENIEIENFVCYPVTELPRGLEGGQINPEHGLRLEGYFHNFHIRGFKKLPAKGDENTYALMMARVKDTDIVADGRTYRLDSTADQVLLRDFENITISKKR